MKEQYKLDWDFKYEIIVEVDHDIFTEEKLNEIYNFWADREDRLRPSRNDILIFILKRLCLECLSLNMESWYYCDESSLIEAFDKSREGWPKMDGSYGIKILSADNFDPDKSDVTVTKI